MLLTDGEFARIRERKANPYMGGALTTTDYMLAEVDRSGLLEHIDTLTEEFHFVSRAATPEDMPEWEEELLLTMCNVTDVRTQLRLIDSLREEVAEKESMIEWLRDA